MNGVSYIFSFLCSQDVLRSFAIGEQLLPFCQRCTGVHVGLGISFVYLLVSGHYKKGLPPRSILYVNIASLLIMPIFGFHLFDWGPMWRLWSGLIFGSAIAFLLFPATSIICNEGKASGYYTKVSTSWFFALFAFLNTIPLWFPVQSGYFYYTVLILAFIGLLCVLFCAVAVTAFLVKKTVVLLILKGFGNRYAKN
ncbi:hypothetical protein ES703_32312 [subsurface metagenome]